MVPLATRSRRMNTVLFAPCPAHLMEVQSGRSMEYVLIATRGKKIIIEGFVPFGVALFRGVFRLLQIMPRALGKV